MVFAEYYLILVQETDTTVTMCCAELDSETQQLAEPVTKAAANTPVIVKASNDVTPCVYFAVGGKIGKLDVPSMETKFIVDSEHSLDIKAMTVASNLGQIVTT